MTKAEYTKVMAENGFCTKVYISKEEAEGREDVVTAFEDGTIVYYVIDDNKELTDTELSNVLTVKCLKSIEMYLKSIKSMVKFFTVLAVLSMIGSRFVRFFSFALL